MKKFNSMLEFGDAIYYLDLKAFDNAITIVKAGKDNKVSETETKTVYDANLNAIGTETIVRATNQSKEIDVAKYDMLKTFIEYIIDHNEETDDSLGSDRALQQQSLGYKIVFNTLIKEGILVEKDV